jgi:hypothetical protein
MPSGSIGSASSKIMRLPSMHRSGPSACSGRYARRSKWLYHFYAAHRAHHRSCGVLAVRDRQDAGTADQSDGWLCGDEAILTGGVQQRARGLGADRGGAQTSRHSDRRTRA